MTDRAPLSFERYAAEQLLHDRVEVTRAWARRVATELPARPSLVDGIPRVLAQVAEFVVRPEEPAFAASEEVVEPLAALARLRQREGRRPQELVRELDLLAQVLDGACLGWLGTYPVAPPPEAVVRVAGRLNRAPILMAEICIAAFREAEDRGRAAGATQVQELAEVLVHELNTPLGAAEGAALLLQDDEMVGSSQERRRFAGLIQRNLRRARILIADVRDFALAQASSTATPRWLPVGQVLAEVLAEVRDLARDAGARIEVTDPMPDVLVDASRLDLILRNLVANAARYSDPGRAERWIRIRLGRGGADASEWWIEVSDNGLGIPPEHQDRVFERFFRAHPERAEGTGLGLAIVKEAVRQLGGHILLRSEPGAGTTFHISFPRRVTGGVE